VFERFTDRARRVVVLGQEEARMLHHDYIGTEHLLLGLIHDGETVACRALESLEISLPAVRARVEEIIGRGQSTPSGHIPFTPRAKKVLELSLREAMQLGHNYIGTEHILLGLIREGDGVGAEVLQSLGADPNKVRPAVVSLMRGAEPEKATSEEPWRLEPDPEPWGKPWRGDPIELVRKAAERTRRARELAEQVAAASGDPSITADEVFYGFLILGERQLGLEVAAKELAEMNQPKEEEKAQEEEGSGES
jgi:ATP-dependent Clp protease ATP-binding subunit ClpA